MRVIAQGFGLGSVSFSIRNAHSKVDGVWMKSYGREANAAEDKMRIHKDFYRR